MIVAASDGKASCSRYCLGAVGDGAPGVAAGGLVVAGAMDFGVRWRGQNTAPTTITTTITATIDNQKRLSWIKFIYSLP